MQPNETLAYLAGVLDSDGYFKITKDRPRGTIDPYYGLQVGLQQLWPGEAVHLFARTFNGRMMKPMIWPGHRPMARCDLNGTSSKSAIRRLLPYLLVKKDQALLLLELAAVKAGDFRLPRGKTKALMEGLRNAVLSLHDGSWKYLGSDLPISGALVGYEKLGPSELGWTRGETLAYLAGIIDSDGNLRITRRPVRGMLGPHYRINIRASQVSPSPAISLLAKTFGGNVTTKKTKRPNQRDLDSWGQWDRIAFGTLSSLAPYLQIKVREAHLLMELRRLKAEGKKGITEWVHQTRWHVPLTMHKRCYTPEQFAQFDRVYWALRALHSGGPIGPGGETQPSASPVELPQGGP